ncbi:MAG: exosortase/archaeosortase family protein [Verrucomicrobia bacterium]|nr:exosortase/archaeosortase family protein [Verrucomicrobiota bacterium]
MQTLEAPPFPPAEKTACARQAPGSAAFLPAGISLLTWGQLAWVCRPEWVEGGGLRFGWVLLLVAPLVWLRSQPPVSPAISPLAGRLCAWVVLIFALAMMWPARWLGEANPDWRLPVWTLGLAAAAVTLAAHALAGGFRLLRAAALPCLILLGSLPWPVAWETFVRKDGAVGICAAAAELLSLAGVPAFAHANVLELPHGPVGVDEACSGLHGLQTCFLAAVALTAVFGLRGRRLLAVFALAGGLALISNLLRVVALAWVHHRGGVTAFHAWHDQVGLLASAVPLALLAWCASRWAGRQVPLGRPPTLAPQVRPALGVAFVLSLSSVLGAELAVARWYHRTAAPLDTAAATEFRFPAAARGFTPIRLGEDVISMLRCQRSAAARWTDAEGIRWLAYQLHWDAGRAALQLARAHHPESCFHMQGATELERAEPIEVRLADGRVLTFARFAFAPRQLPGQNMPPTYVFFARRSAGQDDAGTQADPWSRAERLRLALEARRPTEQQVYEVTLRGPLDLADATRIFQREILGLLETPKR